MLDSEQAALASLQAQLAELNQEELDARVAAATAARDEAAAGLQAAEHAVEAATRELAGVRLLCYIDSCITCRCIIADILSRPTCCTCGAPFAARSYARHARRLLHAVTHPDALVLHYPPCLLHCCCVYPCYEHCLI
jgi:hypothetical protein